jgi:hypothetical protein
MSKKLLYYETMSVQWISEGLGNFFKEIGYTFFSNTVQEINEAFVPLDRIYSAKKGNNFLLFALQFKTPYTKNDLFYWKIDPNQHKLLREEYFSKFIWYCLPFMKNINSYRNILFHSLFVNPMICTHDLKWFIWDDYYLYFYPGGGGCNRFLDQLRHLPCGNIPIKIIDKKLDIAFRSQWNFAINYDSWGSLYYKLLNSEVGFTVRNKQDYDDFIKHIKGFDYPTIDENAIIIAVDTVNQTINAIGINGNLKEYDNDEDQEDIFPLKYE